MGYKTTGKHFNKFKKECELWLERLGLKDWDIEFRHVKELKSLANCNWDIVERWSIISLAQDWGETKPTDYEIKSTAYHEAHELLVAILYTLSTTRYNIDINKIEAERHAIIQRMTNCYFKRDYYGRTESIDMPCGKKRKKKRSKGKRK